MIIQERILCDSGVSEDHCLLGCDTVKGDNRYWLFRGTDGFGYLVVSVLASGTRVRGFKPGQSCWIFWASEKSSAFLPSERKWHVKEPSTSVNYDMLAKFLV